MRRRDFLRTVAAGAVAAGMARWGNGSLAFGQEKGAASEAGGEATGAALGERPNVIVVLSDDVGFPDIGCYGGEFKTPRIDALAKDGVKFERCYSTPLCGPSRCQLLTGQYPFRTGLVSNHSQNAIAPARQIMIPTVMKKAGYATASVGKWGQMPLGPKEWGFDEYLTFKGSGHYWASQGGYREDGKEKELGAQEYLPDVMHKYLMEFITKNRERPFFAYYPMSHIHGPIMKTPDSKGEKGNYYADNVSYMDKLVGQLIDELERLKLREKTLVIFTGDNGTAGFHGNVHGKAISGAKGSMLEGGSRVPLIANWPGTAPTGKVVNDLVDFSDFFPTVAEAGGAVLPADRPMDGRGFLPQIKGQAGKPREWVYVELDGRRYVRDDKWKLSGAGELFDMKDSPFEEKPVAVDSKDVDAGAARQHLREVLVGLVGEKAMEKELPSGGRKRKKEKRGAAGA